MRSNGGRLLSWEPSEWTRLLAIWRKPTKKCYYRKVRALYCYAKWWTGGWVQRHLARSDARRKQPQVVRTSGLDNELRHCVVREQHDFDASTQSIVHRLHAKLSSVCLSTCVSIYLFICLSIHPSIFLHIYPSISLSIHLSIYSLFVYLAKW